MALYQWFDLTCAILDISNDSQIADRAQPVNCRALRTKHTPQFCSTGSHKDMFGDVRWRRDRPVSSEVKSSAFITRHQVSFLPKISFFIVPIVACLLLSDYVLRFLKLFFHHLSFYCISLFESFVG